MHTFNKAHVFSKRPDSKISDDTPSPSCAVQELEAKRQAILATAQQAGGFELPVRHQH